MKTVIMLAVAASIVLAPVPAAAAPAMWNAARAPKSDGTSVNWSGYAAEGSGFTEVHASWKIPTVKPAAALATDATWVGIGGMSGADLIQSGTQGVTENNQVAYQAWIEMLPAASQPLSIAVRGEDTVSVDIVQRGAGKWRISFIDQSTGSSAHKDVEYTSSLSSAEWIEEAPTDQNGVMPLDGFGRVAFADAGAVKSGKAVGIAGSGAQPIAMVNAAGAVLAAPSKLNRDGNAFSVARSAVKTAGSVPGRMFDHLHGWTRGGSTQKKR